jgi:phosphoenolpyruvate-protein phosphotransferase (PTS system enzyme I)
MRAEPLPAAETLLVGLGVSPGIAIGPAYVVDGGEDDVPHYVLLPDAIADELVRFQGAVDKSLKQLAKLKSKAASLPNAAAEELGFLLDAHVAMLSGSRLTRGIQRRIREDRFNAASAVRHEIQALAESFAGLADAYIASRVGDVREVGRRLIRNLLDQKFRAFSAVPEGSIIFAEELTPADTALMDPRRIAGLATALGGAEGHTAIMARALGLPGVLGVAGLVTGVHSGDQVVIDGVAGVIVVHPAADTLAEYRRQADALERERRNLRKLRKLPALTRDGHLVTLRANVELISEAETAHDAGAEGVGLLRTEFLYMNREDLPGEEEQYSAYRAVVERMQGQPVTLRTLDVGGDKLTESLGGRFQPAMNPALGLRAIRLSLKEPKLLEAQFAAMLRAGAHGPVRIMLPMISRIDEVRQSRAVLMRVARRLKRRGVAIADPLPPLGIMVEVPAAALNAPGLANEADFFSIGTNDLIQYTLAIDRGDEQVARMFDPLHPSVLRLIHMTTQAALHARIPVAVCGEMAGDPRLTALLVGLGVRELSMTPTKIPLIKRRVRCLDLAVAHQRAQAMLGQYDSADVAALLDVYNAETVD